MTAAGRCQGDGRGLGRRQDCRRGEAGRGRSGDTCVKLTSTPLVGRFVRLEPLGPLLREPVRAAISVPDPIWPIMGSSSEGVRFDGWWDRAVADMADDRRVAYAVRRLADEAVVGSTSFLHIDAESGSVEIGSTFLQPDARGGPVNPQMKWLMLNHAFDAGAARVEIRTDARNLRSQAAIAKLGAVREGVLRRQKRLWTGELRDTVVFSVIADDWPSVRERLDTRLAGYGA
jgi:N-acetyltransferase